MQALFWLVAQKSLRGQSGYVDLNERISQFVAGLIDDREISIAEFGRMMGENRQQAERYVKGQREWGSEWLEKAATALKLEPWELVRGEAFTLAEQPSVEFARFLLRQTLGREPTPGQADLHATLLRAIVDVLARHPATRSDHQAAKMAIDFLAQQSG